MPTDRSLTDPGPSPLWPLLATAGLFVTLWRMAPARDGAPGRAATAAPPPPGSRGKTGPASGAAADPAGAGAETPADIPARGWLAIGKRVVAGIGDDRVVAVAAGVTFYALLALFPAVAALVSLYGLFTDPSTIAKQLDGLSSVLPGGALQIIGDQVKAITSKPSGSLGLATALSLAISLWSANAGMKAVFDALNVVYKEKEARSFFRLNLVSLAFTVGAMVLLLLALGMVIVVPIVLNFFGLQDIGAQVIALARWPLLLVVIVLGLAVLYRYGPSRRDAQWRWVTPGSALAAVAWLVASAGFSFYVGKFGSYNATYGSLGAAIGFMTWIWISSIVVLVGGEVSAETEHQTGRDTTTGPERPEGQRGAAMADRAASGR